MRTLRALIAMLLFSSLGFGQTPAAPAQSGTAAAAFDRLQTLVGEWEGQASEHGHEIPATTSYRPVSADSVLMNVLAAGTPHEMITMFHMDGSDLIAIHYCAAHNQPRFRFVANPEPKVVAFEFKDATKLASPSTPHMVAVKFTFVDPNHHIEDWTSVANGQTSTRRFDFRRKQ
jgi:hypothetical protein